MRPGWENWDYPLHVGMAATLFRREQLVELTFRWEPGKCECQCFCDDLRRGRFGIGYLPVPPGMARPAPGTWGKTPLPCAVTNARQARGPLSWRPAGRAAFWRPSTGAITRGFALFPENASLRG